MVILFSKRKSPVQKEIAEILYKFGGNFIGDKSVRLSQGEFTVLSVTKPYDLDLKEAVVIFCDENEKFEKQVLPKGIIGICEAENKTALKILKRNSVAAITCGNGAKNTVTIASITPDTAIISLQRTLFNLKGRKIEPADFKIKPPKNCSSFSIMAAVTALLLCKKSQKNKN